jgi:hypothetical protein
VRKPGRVVALVSILILTSFPIYRANAAATTVVNLAVGNVCSNGPYTSGTYAQLYTAGNSANVSSIRILIGSGSTAYFSNSNVKIYADNNLVPGSLLGTFSPSTVSGGYATYTGSVDVTSGSRFWVYPSYTTGNNSWCYDYPTTGAASVYYAAGWTNTFLTTLTNKYYIQTSTNGASWNTASTSTFVMQIQIITNDGNADSTPPTFPSADSFSVNENTTTVGTITTSESATITVFGGADSARFSVTRSSDSSTALAFLSAPNYEAPSDVGGNNVYDVVLKAVDGSSNVGYETLTVTVLNVVETSSFNSLSLASNTVTASYRTPVSINASVSVSARVTFMAQGKRIPGCISKLASGSGSTFLVSCAWKPPQKGSVSLTATAVPVGAGISGATSEPLRIQVLPRVGSR